MTGDQELLKRSIHRSQLTRAQFAERLLSRDERTVYRWLKGETPLPPAVVAWLKRWEELSDGTRERIIGALAS